MSVRSHSIAKSNSAARVLVFPSSSIVPLERVAADCRTLKIPSYERVCETFGDSVDRYEEMVRAHMRVDSQKLFDRAWSGFIRQTGLDPQVVKTFRDSTDYQRALDLRREAGEHALYLMGLYIARREFPRLGGGVL